MINDLLNNLFKGWCDTSKCGKCWVYVKTFNDIISGNTNLYRPLKDDACCTHIFLEGLSTRTTKDINNITGDTRVLHCDYNIHLKIGELSDFGMQKGSEIVNGEGIYDKHIAPLMECLSCDFENDLCDSVEDGKAIIINETSTPFFSKGDYNWAGIDMRFTLRHYID